MPEQLHLEGTCNARDLGGYPTSDGCQTRWRTVIRSARLSQLSPSGQQAMLDCGIRTIIDLRDAPELRAAPDNVEGGVNYLNIPLLADLHESDLWRAARVNMQTQYDLYQIILSCCQRQIGAILSAVIENPPAILIHCTGGKDRTGIIIALLLAVAKVPETVIVEDYAQSYVGLAEWREADRALAVQTGRDMQRFERDWECSAQNMIRMFAHLNEHYGNVPSYLKGCGLTDDFLLQLRARLVELE